MQKNTSTKITWKAKNSGEHNSGKIIEDVDFASDITTTVRAKSVLTVHGIIQERIRFQK
ncbi:MAG: hypothetical protein ABI416_04155 [Ginsengibacter sp.]